MDTEQIIDLVNKVKAGDETAFAHLYDEFADRIYAFISIKTIGTNEADDILQDVFLKAWKGCQNLNIEDLNFSAWLYKIASNTVNDFYRKRYRNPEPLPLDEAMGIKIRDDAMDDANLHFDKKLIRQALDKLPLNYKQVIELRFFQEFNINETASILDKSSVIIRVWQHRAVKQLEKIFDKYKNHNERLT